jgi:hypothetical protein
MGKPKFVSRNQTIDNMHGGGCLCPMHTREGLGWVTLPGTGTGTAGCVKPAVALEIITMPNVVGSQDSLFPNMSQTYRLITQRESAHAPVQPKPPKPKGN